MSMSVITTGGNSRRNLSQKACERRISLDSGCTTGSIAVVGAPLRHERAPASGAAYSFVRANGVWEEKKKVVLDDERQKLNFGTWVAMSGNTVVVSAHNDTNDGPGWGNGTAAFVYSSVEDFGTPPFSVEPIWMALTTFGRVREYRAVPELSQSVQSGNVDTVPTAADAPVIINIFNVGGQLTRELNLGVQKRAPI